MAVFKFRVGEKVRVTKLGSHGCKRGDIVTISEVDEFCGGTQPYLTERHRWFYENEIERIVAEDETEYRRKNFEDVEVGDYWTADVSSLDIEQGGRYLVTDVATDVRGGVYVRFKDNIGDDRIRFSFALGHIVSKVVPSRSMPAARVTIKFDVMPWEDISVGSKLLALSDDLGVTAGKIYTVNRVDSVGCVEFTDDESEDHEATSTWVLRHVKVRKITEKGA